MRNPAKPPTQTELHARPSVVVSRPIAGRIARSRRGTTRIGLEQSDAFEVGDTVLVYALASHGHGRLASGVLSEPGIVQLSHDFAREGTRVWVRRQLQADSTCSPVAGGSDTSCSSGPLSASREASR